MPDSNQPNTTAHMFTNTTREIIGRPRARALKYDEEAKLHRYLMEQFELGNLVPRCYAHEIDRVLQVERNMNEWGDGRKIKETSTLYFGQYVKRWPEIMINSEYSFLYKRQCVERPHVEKFFSSLWAARRDPPVFSHNLFYLSMTRFPAFAPGQPVPPLYKVSESDIVNVLDCYSAAGEKQKKPFFVQYSDGGSPQELGNGVLLVPRTFTRDDMLRRWFDSCFSQSTEKRVLIIDDDRAKPSEEFRDYSCKKNVHLVRIPSNLSPHFSPLDISVGKSMIGFYKNRMKPSSMENWVTEYTKARNASLCKSIRLRWEKVCVTIEERDFQTVVDIFWEKVVAAYASESGSARKSRPVPALQPGDLQPPASDCEIVQRPLSKNADSSKTSHEQEVGLAQQTGPSVRNDQNQSQETQNAVNSSNLPSVPPFNQASSKSKATGSEVEPLSQVSSLPMSTQSALSTDATQNHEKMDATIDSMYRGAAGRLAPAEILPAQSPQAAAVNAPATSPASSPVGVCNSAASAIHAITFSHSSVSTNPRHLPRSAVSSSMGKISSTVGASFLCLSASAGKNAQRHQPEGVLLASNTPVPPAYRQSNRKRRQSSRKRRQCSRKRRKRRQTELNISGENTPKKKSRKS